VRIAERIRLMLRGGGAAAPIAGALPPAEANAARAEYVRRVDELAELRRRIADAAAGRRNIEAKVDAIDRRRDDLRHTAALAARDGRDADAKAALAEELALERRVAPQTELLAGLRTQERALSDSAGKIEAAIESTRARLDDLDRRGGAAG
jgi:phage shock protein A